MEVNGRISCNYSILIKKTKQHPPPTHHIQFNSPLQAMKSRSRTYLGVLAMTTFIHLQFTIRRRYEAIHVMVIRTRHDPKTLTATFRSLHSCYCNSKINNDYKSRQGWVMDLEAFQNEAYVNYLKLMLSMNRVIEWNCYSIFGMKIMTELMSKRKMIPKLMYKSGFFSVRRFKCYLQIPILELVSFL